jgi:xylan 1,4-beta-xylosidase
VLHGGPAIRRQLQGGNFKDTHNYLTTCVTIDGEWSEPVYLNSSGFDPSLYHAQDGRKWFLNMVWDHRPDRTFFGGIRLQEYSPAEGRLVGESALIFEGSEHGCTEGPHLYRHGDDYYLMTAEGGTGYDHVVTMARSRGLQGPYEVDPAGPMLTARDTPGHPLQRTGHGDLVDSPDGRYFLVHLCSRPLPGTRRSPLGRETAIQRIERTADGWFRLASGGILPEESVDVGAHSGDRPASTGADRPGQVDRFDGPELPDHYQWLRCPHPEDLFSLTERPGYLRLFGRESPGSLYRQSLVARRQEHFAYEAETEIRFEPEHFQQLAGLICYYNSTKFHYLYLSRDAEVGKHLAVLSCEGDLLQEGVFPGYDDRVPVPEGCAIRLRARVRGPSLVFSWSADGEKWRELPFEFDASLLSDEAGKGEGAQFTGAFVGMCCNDLAGTGRPADFAWFSYRPLH